MKEVKRYLTDYLVGTDTYSSFVLAINKTQALKLCTKRNLGEKIISTPRPYSPSVNAFIRRTDSDDFYHTLCFVGFVAVKSGHSVDEIFGDHGIVHEMIHAKLFCPKKSGRFPIQYKLYLNLCKELGFII